MNIALKQVKTFAGMSLIAASVSAVAQGSGPVKVADTSNADPSLSPLSQLRAETSERYIITFQETGTSVDEVASTDSVSSGTGFFDGTADRAQERAVYSGRFNAQVAERLLSDNGATPVRTIGKHKMVAATMSKRVFNRLRKNPQIANISPDPRRYTMAQSTPYGIPMVQADQLSQNNLSARKVCVIDTGYNLGHPDLPDQNNGVTGQANNSQVGNWFNDGNGHGTHVAGTVAALSNNEGVVGVYPGVDLHIVKIFNDSGSWTFASDLIDGIQQCADAGSNVVNMSLGGGSSSTAERNALQSFNNQGILLVAAAGNDGNSSFSYPASYDAVVSVGAVGSNESWASYSQYNSQVEIAGPGTGVNSTWPVNTYRSISGTSMATPHVAGVAALVWSFFPQCSNTQIRDALNDTAKDKGSAGRDNFYGFGLVQARDAYDYLNTFGCVGDTGNGGGGNGGVEPVSGQLTDLSGSRGAWNRYTWNVPAGVSTLTVEISGGSGDADLYMRLGSQPSTSSYDCRPYLNGNNEVCTFNNPSPGTWHIGIRAYSTYNGVTMDYSYQ